MEKMNNGNETRKTGKGFFSDILLKIQLTVKLVGDPRVSFSLKLIPIFCLIYLILPLDLLFGPVDDAVILYFGMDVFISMCPDTIVQEYTSRLNGENYQEDGEVIDVDFKED
jgi:uncharacterized membrane protein YkvA (DUF1232 family)